MKKISILFVLGIFVGNSGLQAQINNVYNLYFEELYIINPAAAAQHDYISADFDVNLSNAGFEGSPKTFGLYINGAFSEKAGAGLRLTNDTRGAFSVYNFTGSYAYKIKLGPDDHFINMGLSIGLYSQKLSVGEIDATDLDDPVLGKTYYSKKHFINEIGVMYVWKDLQAGISAPYIAQLYNHYIGYTSYQYKVPSLEGFEITPVVLYQYLPEGKSQADVTLKLKYKPVWTAVTYRSNNNILFALGALYNKYRLSYSFEFNNKELTNISSSTHEIMVSYNFNLNLTHGQASYKKDKMPWQDDN